MLLVLQPVSADMTLSVIKICGTDSKATDVMTWPRRVTDLTEIRDTNSS